LIRLIEQSIERLLAVDIKLREAAFEKTRHQNVHFTHPAPTLPAQPSRIGRQFAQTKRCTMSFLVSAIAFAGLSPLGQALAQFMMV
jgi:hypothetical protein